MSRIVQKVQTDFIIDKLSIDLYIASNLCSVIRLRLVMNDSRLNRVHAAASNCGYVPAGNTTV